MHYLFLRCLGLAIVIGISFILTKLISSYSRVRIERAKASKMQNSITLNITGGTVGNVNLGAVLGSLTSEINQLHEKGEEELTSAIKGLTEAIANSEDVSDSVKKETLEQIESIAKEADKPVSERKSSVAKGVLNNIKEVLSVSESLLSVWKQAAPIILGIFSL